MISTMLFSQGRPPFFGSWTGCRCLIDSPLSHDASHSVHWVQTEIAQSTFVAHERTLCIEPSHGVPPLKASFTMARSRYFWPSRSHSVQLLHSLNSQSLGSSTPHSSNHTVQVLFSFMTSLHMSPPDCATILMPRSLSCEP